MSSNQPDSNDKLTPQGEEILRGILEDTKGLRGVDLADVPPAPIFEAE